MENTLAYELQLGNSILRKNSNDKWIETKVNLTYLSLIHEYPYDYKGIELTRELLIINGYSEDKCTNDGSLIVIFYSKENVLLSEDFKLDAIEEMKPLKYLHQLQNLEKIINS